MKSYQTVDVTLLNGVKYRVKCLNVKRIGSIVLCELANPENLDFGLLFWKNKMFIYGYPETGKCVENYKPLDILFVEKLCVKEINDIKGAISEHFYDRIS